MQTLVWNRSWRLCEDISHSLVQNSWWIMAENDWTLFGIFEIRDTLSMWKSMDLTKTLRNSSQHICWMSDRFKRSESDKLQVPIVVALANITLWRFPRVYCCENLSTYDGDEYTHTAVKVLSRHVFKSFLENGFLRRDSILNDRVLFCKRNVYMFLMCYEIIKLMKIKIYLDIIETGWS